MGSHLPRVVFQQQKSRFGPKQSLRGKGQCDERRSGQNTHCASLSAGAEYSQLCVALSGGDRGMGRISEGAKGAGNIPAGK